MKLTVVYLGLMSELCVDTWEPYKQFANIGKVILK